MRLSLAAAVFALPLLAAVPASAASGEISATYATYARGLDVAEVEAGFGMGPWNYQVRLAYHTTGLVGFFYRGHQFNEVSGSWLKDAPDPKSFFGEGTWRGEDRVARIDYLDQRPTVKELVPPNEAEREAVPAALQANSIDTLSALAELMRHVADAHRCETTVHTYDGRRATEITARTVGMETLEASHGSSFSGPALRCDFTGRMLAGFRFSGDRESDERPLHGSAWMADVAPNAPPMPVRMTFETHWFGDATMYMTSVTPGSATLAVNH
jgi:hypothetical protein